MKPIIARREKDREHTICPECGVPWLSRSTEGIGTGGPLTRTFKPCGHTQEVSSLF